LLCGAIAGVCVMANWGAMLPSAQAQVSGGNPPALPAAWGYPSTPIVAGRGDLGYLPGSQGVSSTGQLTYSIPIDVPAGRAGMQPKLSLEYVSDGGNGVLGVGWSLGGLSSIRRCRQTLATEGQVRGVHLADSNASPALTDRFCLDGKKLVAISGTYGEPGAEYRTEEDTYVRILSQQDPTKPGVSGALLFTVDRRDGITRHYSGLYDAQQLTGLNTYSTTSFAGATQWVVTAETDPAGNGVEYHYDDSATLRPHPAAWGLEYAPMSQWLLRSIVYTTATDHSDEGHRRVDLDYEDRPDVEFGFQAGVGTALFQRLKKITVSAPFPDPTHGVAPTAAAWQYLLTYGTSAFSNRSEISSVQRCAIARGEAPGGCTWKKEFEWITDATPVPQWSGDWQTVWGPGLIGGVDPFASNPLNPPLDPLNGATFDPSDPFSYPVPGTWKDNPPVIQVLDVDGDGRDDVLFQPGGPAGPSNVLLTAPTTPASVPVNHPLSVQSNPQTNGLLRPSADPASGGDRQALQSVAPLDLDGDGSAELFVTQARVEGAQVLCQSKGVHWDGSSNGFVDVGLGLPSYTCRNPYHAAKSYQFFSIRGERGLDNVQAAAQTFGPSGANNPDYADLPGSWQDVQFNDQGAQFTSAPALPLDTAVTNYTGPAVGAPAVGAMGFTSAACQTYVVDFYGDGKGQLYGQEGGASATEVFVDNDGHQGYTHGIVNCGYEDFLESYDLDASAQWQWQVTANEDPSMLGPHTDPIGNTPSNPIFPRIPVSTFNGADLGAAPGSVLFPDSASVPRLIFGDFNGDSLEDVLEWDGALPYPQGLALRWNTGNGFGPSVSVSTPWYQPAGAQQVVVADVNHDGRADVVIFHSLPSPAITLMLSNGDGSFSSEDVATTQDSQDQPIADYPGMTVFTGIGLGAQRIVAAVGDFTGDGYVDLARLAPTPLPNPDVPTLPTGLAELQVMAQQPAIADRVTAIFDEPMLWPRASVTYSLQWSDKPEPVTLPCAPPQQCLRRGFAVVREVDTFDTLADPTDADLLNPHRVFYSYEDPVSDQRGRGFLGFRKVREWDPTQPRQTLTEYDNRTCVPTACTSPGSYYPGAMRARKVTTVVPIPITGSQVLPAVPRKGASSVNARVVQTLYEFNHDQTAYPTGQKTHVVNPYRNTTTEWEQKVQMAASVLDPADPASDYIWNTNASPPIVAPAHPLRVHTTTFDRVDTYGNVTHRTDQTTGGVDIVSVACYQNLPDPDWRIGLLRYASVTAIEPPSANPADPVEAPVTRQTGYDYDANGQLLTIHRYQVAPNAPTPSACPFASSPEIGTTTLTRDSYGLVTGVAVQALGPDNQIDTREVRFEYDPLWPGQPNERVFRSQTWMPQSQASWQPSTWTLIHPAYGLVSATMDVNGVQVSHTYDDQGRRVGSQTDGEAPVSISYAGRPDQGVYGGVLNGLVVTSHTGGQTATQSTDADGRLLGATHLDMNGTVTQTSKVTYDLLGRALSVSRPYQGTAPAYQTTYLYDGLSRLLDTTAPDNTHTTNAPTFFTDTVTDAMGHQRRITKDVDRRVVASAQGKDPSWVTTKYHYAPFSTIDQVTDPLGNIESTSYDTLGRIVSHVGADDGTTTNSVYDGFDELLSSQHAESGALINYDYDSLGRLKGWASSDGPTSITLTYDTQLHGLGKLATTASSDDVTTAHYYDAYGRSIGTNQTVAGTTYTTSVSYDSQGRIGSVSYPSIGKNKNPGMTLRYTYTATDYLAELDYQTASPLNNSVTTFSPLWTAKSRNVDDAVLVAQLGKQVATQQNAYIDATGRLRESKTTASTSNTAAFDLCYQYYPNGLTQARMDPVNAREDSFVYDNLDRLTDWTLSTGAASACPASGPLPTQDGSVNHYDYDDTGNLTDVLFATSSGAPLTTAQLNTYGGGGFLGGPHALSGQTVIAHSLNGHPIGGVTGATVYEYDTHGRQSAGGARKLAYNAFDLPSSVIQSGTVWKLSYDAMGERVLKDGGADGTTTYVGGVYEHRKSDSGVEDVFIVPGVAQIEVDGSGVTTPHYLMTDALGSVNALLDNVTGSVTGRFFYDPFGRRINIDGTDPSSFTGDVKNGFTGQEHDDAWGLINFQGRLYDPNLKRFMTPDPLVSAPLLGQSWNRYSYVRNSPLNAIDPSGFTTEGGNDEVGLPMGSNDTQILVSWKDPDGSGLANSFGGYDGTGSGIGGPSAVPQSTTGSAAGLFISSQPTQADPSALQCLSRDGNACGAGPAARGNFNGTVVFAACREDPNSQACKDARDSVPFDLGFGPMAIEEGGAEIAAKAAAKSGIFGRALTWIAEKIPGTSANRAAKAAEAAALALKGKAAVEEAAKVILEGARQTLEAAAGRTAAQREIVEGLSAKYEPLRAEANRILSRFNDTLSSEAQLGGKTAKYLSAAENEATREATELGIDLANARTELVRLEAEQRAAQAAYDAADSAAFGRLRDAGYRGAGRDMQ